MSDPRPILADLIAATIDADREISRAEMDVIASLRRLGLGDLTPFVSEALRRKRDDPTDAGEIAARFDRLAPEGGAILISVLAEIAGADSILSKPELDVLRAIGDRFGLSDSDRDKLIEASTGHSERPLSSCPAHRRAKHNRPARRANPK